MSLISSLRSLRFVAMALLLALSAGCSLFGSKAAVKPRISLVDVELNHARLLEQEFMLEFRIDNPNDNALPIRGLNYDVQLNGMQLGFGQSTNWITVPANGHAYVRLPVHTNLWRHLKGILKLLERPNEAISYNLKAELRTGLNGRTRIPLRKEGTFVPGQYLSPLLNSR